MQYGEGEKAFVRLQQEIARTTSDMSIFAWGLDSRPLEEICYEQSDAVAERSGLSLITANIDSKQVSKYGLYADSPRRFLSTRIEHLAYDIGDVGSEERRGVQNLKTMVVHSGGWSQFARIWESWSLALLPCFLPGSPHCLVGILLIDWDPSGSRSMRHAFRGEVFSCLIRSEHISEAVQYSVKIDSAETRMYQRQFLGHHVPLLTLSVKMKGMEYYPFQILEPAGWRQASHDQNCFSMDWFSKPISVEEHVTTILRFHHQGASISVYVGFSQQEPTTEKPDCVILAEPVSTSTDVMLRKIQYMLELPSASRPRVCIHDSCTHDCLCVTAETIVVFNQLLTTITLAKIKKGSYDESMVAVCVSPEERLGLELI